MRGSQPAHFLSFEDIGKSQLDARNGAGYYAFREINPLTVRQKNRHKLNREQHNPDAPNARRKMPLIDSLHQAIESLFGRISMVVMGAFS